MLQETATPSHTTPYQKCNHTKPLKTVLPPTHSTTLPEGQQCQVTRDRFLVQPDTLRRSNSATFLTTTPPLDPHTPTLCQGEDNAMF